MRVRNIILAVIISITTTAILSAQPNQTRRDKPDRLNLTEQQKQQLKDLRFQSSKEKIQRQADLKVARLEYRQLMSEDLPDRSQVMSKLDQISQLQSNLRKHQVDSRLSARELFTPEQRSKLRNIHRNMRLHHRTMNRAFHHRGMRMDSFRRHKIDRPGFDAFDTRDFSPREFRRAVRMGKRAY